MASLSDDALEILQENHAKSGGHCGTYPADLRLRLGVEYKTLRPVLNRLFKEKQITIHLGSRGILIKYRAVKPIKRNIIIPEGKTGKGG